jgi:hypothetical protein
MTKRFKRSNTEIEDDGKVIETAEIITCMPDGDGSEIY